MKGEKKGGGELECVRLKGKVTLHQLIIYAKRLKCPYFDLVITHLKTQRLFCTQMIILIVNNILGYHLTCMKLSLNQF